MVGAIIYEGIENLSLQAWYYNIKDFVDLTYLESGYKTSFNNINFNLATQYSIQNYINGEAKIFGIETDLNLKKFGLTLGIAFNKVNSNNANVTNGFGGGSFFTSGEHLTIDNDFLDTQSKLINIDFDTKIVGLNGLNLSATYIDFKAINYDANELDMIASYSFNDNLSIDYIFSDMKENREKIINRRVFINYSY